MIKKHKADIILVSAILITGIIFALVFVFCSKNGARVVVSIDGNEYGSYALSKNDVIEINNPDGGVNILSIKDGYASVVDASCPDKLCVHMGKISKSGQSVICLPNKVTVYIEGGEDDGIDAMAGGVNGTK